MSAAMPLTHRRQTAAVSRYTVAFKVLEDSVSGGAGDSSGFRVARPSLHLLEEEEEVDAVLTR